MNKSNLAFVGSILGIIIGIRVITDYTTWGNNSAYSWIFGLFIAFLLQWGFNDIWSKCLNLIFGTTTNSEPNPKVIADAEQQLYPYAQIVKMRKQGLTDQQIGAALNMSPKDVRSYIYVAGANQQEIERTLAKVINNNSSNEANTIEFNKARKG